MFLIFLGASSRIIQTVTMLGVTALSNASVASLNYVSCIKVLPVIRHEIDPARPGGGMRRPPGGKIFEIPKTKGRENSLKWRKGK